MSESVDICGAEARCGADVETRRPTADELVGAVARRLAELTAEAAYQRTEIEGMRAAWYEALDEIAALQATAAKVRSILGAGTETTLDAARQVVAERDALRDEVAALREQMEGWRKHAHTLRDALDAARHDMTAMGARAAAARKEHTSAAAPRVGFDAGAT